MKKLIDALLAAALGLLMSMPELALAQTATARNHWVAPAIPDQSLVNHQPWPDTQLLNPSPYISIAPTGTIAGDEAAFEATGITTTPNTVVYMRPGIYQICKQETLSWNVTLLGAIPSGYAGSAAPIPQQNLATIQCPNLGGSWTAGQAFIATQDNDVIYGIAIIGNAGFTIGGSDPTQAPGGVGVDCVADHNAIGVTIVHSNMSKCVGWGVNALSDGAVPGHSVAYTQALRLEFSQVGDNLTGAINGNYANGGVNAGGFVSDVIIGPGNDIGANGGSSGLPCPAEIYMRDAVGWRIMNNTIEDGWGCGIYAQNLGISEIIGNSFDKEGILFVNGGFNLTVTGNRWGPPEFDSSVQPVRFGAGAYGPIHMLNNDYGFSSNCILIDPAGTIAGSQFDTAAVGCDTYSKSVLEPNRLVTGFNTSPSAPLVLSGSTFAAPDLTKTRNVAISLVHSACSGGCGVPNANTAGLAPGQQFAFTISQDPSTGGSTINWGNGYINTPTLSAGAEEITSVTGTVVTGGTVQFGTASTLTQPNPNLLTGGSGMTSGWAGDNILSFTNGTVTNPDGTTVNGSTVIENTASSFSHGVLQNNTTATGVRTFSVYAKATGTGGTRTPTLTVCGIPCNSNYIFLGLNEAGTVNFINVSAFAHILDYGVIPSTNGWTRYFVTYTLGSVVPTSQEVALFNVSANSITYPGDGVSGLNLWQPEDRAGFFYTGVIANAPLPIIANGDVLGYAAGSGSGMATAVPVIAGTGIGLSATAGSLTISNTGGGSSPSETFIATQTATTGVTTELDFTALSTAYASLHLVCRNIVADTNPSSLHVQVGEGGGPFWETASTYRGENVYGYHTSATSGAQSDTFPDLLADLFGAINNVAPSYFDMVFTKPNLSGQFKPAYTKFATQYDGTTGMATGTIYSYWLADTNTITGLRLIDGTGTFGGNCSLYGQN